MLNVLENIPFETAGMGRRKVADLPEVLIMQIALLPGQAVPAHEANARLHLLVVQGHVTVTLSGITTEAPLGTIVPVAIGTMMGIENRSAENASFLVIKTPNPNAA